MPRRLGPLASLVAPPVLDSGFRVQDSGFRVQDSGFRVQDSGFRVQDSGFRVGTVPVDGFMVDLDTQDIVRPPRTGFRV